MPNCDVCLVECRDGGVLACRHVVCRACGMSQSKCLVCARIVGRNRKRPNSRQLLPPNADLQTADLAPDHATLPRKSPRILDTKPPTSKPTSLHPYPDQVTKSSPRLSPLVHHAAPTPEPDVTKPKLSPRRGRRLKRKSHSPTRPSDQVQPAAKVPKTKPAPNPAPRIMSVQGPTAFDEVRCELRAVGSAPRLTRSALRTTGKVSIAVLQTFVHTILQLDASDKVILRCSGEELTGAMTLNQLVKHVWPESEGHMVLDYRVDTDSGGGKPAEA